MRQGAVMLPVMQLCKLSVIASSLLLLECYGLDHSCAT
jgi:hypothetical protein